MRKSVEILLLEKNINLADQLIKELATQDCGYRISHVTNVESFIDEVSGTEWDIIISGYSNFGWTALDTMSFLRDNGIETPLIVVTEPQSEEIAANCIKKGAADYLVYPNIQKIYSCISSLLNNRKNAADFAKLSKKEFFRSFELMYESMPMPIILFDETTLEILFVNQIAEEYFRLSRDQIINGGSEEIDDEKYENVIRFIPKLSKGLDKIANWRHYRKDGTVMDAEISSRTIHLSDGKIRVSIVTDLSNQKRIFEPISLRLN